MKTHHERKADAARFYIETERPEEFAKDPLIYYTPDRVEEYARSKSLMRIQETIALRAIHLAQITPPALTLDLGMGCGFATTILFLKKFRPVGIDLNRLFLTYYSITDFNPIEADMRHVGFRPGIFDFILSISAVQWLLTDDHEKKRHQQLNRLAVLCAQLLKPQGKLVFQFYPKSDDRMKELGAAFDATNAFTGNFIIDNVDSPKKRRVFLILQKK